MNPRSARTLLWVSAALLVAGSVVGAPEAGVAALAMAALCALAPAVAGKGKTRVAAAVLLVVALGLAFLKYPEAKRQMERYRERAPRGDTNSR